MSIAVNLGSAFDERAVPLDSLQPVEIDTQYGAATLDRWTGLRDDQVMGPLVCDFLARAKPVPFGNNIYRY